MRRPRGRTGTGMGAALVLIPILIAFSSLPEVGCDDVIVSGRRRDACGVCGGDNSTCRRVSGLFTRPQLPVGYNLVAQIPAGACNINVTEMHFSRNYLALRSSVDGSYIVNGNWAISWSGEHEGAGTRFLYRRQREGGGSGGAEGAGAAPEEQLSSPEQISAPGPLSSPVDLMLIYQQPNPGIKYEYMLPVDKGTQSKGSENEAIETLNRRQGDEVPASGDSGNSAAQVGGRRANRRRNNKGNKFVWKVTAATSSCSRTCGGGVQTAVVACVKDSTQAPVAERKCRAQEKPAAPVLSCNPQPCSSSASEEPSRKTLCPEQEEGESRGESKGGNPELCAQADRPSQVQPIPQGQMAPTWLFTDWSQECSEECGRGVQTRKVQCSSPEGNCDMSQKPVSSRTCSSDRQCRGKWFTGPWSQCSSEWCGEEGRERRQVVCVSFLHGQLRVSLDLECAGQRRPEAERSCSPPAAACAAAHWLRGEWGPCNAPCSVGVQKRPVLCLAPTHAPPSAPPSAPSSLPCDPTLKPPSRRPCNTHPCGSAPSHPTPSVLPEQPHHSQPHKDGECVDKFRNCHLVVQARLCRYKYYKSACCSSCGNSPPHLVATKR